MLGHTYVESNDALVLCINFVCCAMHHVDFIDVIVSFSPSLKVIFLNAFYRDCVDIVSCVCK